ncbi:MAG: Na+/H+ antiporter NhaA, partial [Planctomycetota bacterium]
MSGHSGKKQNPVIRFLIENSLLLIIGSVAALVWANMAYDKDAAAEGKVDSYKAFVNYDLAALWGGGHGSDDHDVGAEGAGGESLGDQTLADDEHGDDTHAEDHDGEHGDHGADSHGHGLTIHFVINDILMALFFAIAAKEVWESLLPGGALSNPRKAATPLLATVGGILGPVAVYLLGA